ncbi:hypothetical protein NECID01_1189 [Nematocida sp. AWRm77]|nr:hypothetical protein NECID01_1189 [Nematocida sp. AWRm77]
MKIFSILLLQCTKVSCRMKNCFVPKDCEVLIELSAPTKKDVEFLDAQYQIICSMTTEEQENQFVLLKILEGLEKTCQIESSTFLFEMAPTKEELTQILDKASSSSTTEDSVISGTLSKERMECLYSFLMKSKIDNGFLMCTKCKEVYPISNGIIDFVKLDEVL